MTSAISIKDKLLCISGAMTFSSAAELWAMSEKIFPTQTQAVLKCDLSQVNAVDSTGLVLLLEWIKLAKRQHQQIQFSNIPAQLHSIARAAGLDQLLANFVA